MNKLKPFLETELPKSYKYSIRTDYVQAMFIEISCDYLDQLMTSKEEEFDLIAFRNGFIKSEGYKTTTAFNTCMLCTKALELIDLLALKKETPKNE